MTPHYNLRMNQSTSDLLKSLEIRSPKFLVLISLNSRYLRYTGNCGFQNGFPRLFCIIRDFKAFLLVYINFLSFQPRMPRRQITPVNSPQKEKYGDRFIPSRAGNNWQVNFNMIQVSYVLLLIIIRYIINVSDIRVFVKIFKAMADADKYY